MLYIGYNIYLPNNYNEQIKEYFNSIQIMFASTKISIIDINNINKFFKNNKHLKYIFIHSSYKINIGSNFILYPIQIKIVLNIKNESLNY